MLLTLTVAAEASGMALLLPILSFVEHGRDVLKFAESPALAGEMVQHFQRFGLPINLLSLSTVALTFIIVRQAFSYSASRHESAH